MMLLNHFSKYMEDDLHIEVTLYFIGHEICAPDKEVAYHNKQQGSFHFVISGKGTLSIAGKKYGVGENDIFYLPPNRNDIFYFPDKKDPWEYIWFNLSGNCQKLALCAKFDEKGYVYHIVNNATTVKHELGEMIYIAKNTEERKASYYFPYVMKVIGLVANERKTGSTLNYKKKLVNKILSEIENHYTEEDFTLTHLAQKFFFSSAYISKVVKEVTGKKPTEHLRDLRLLKSRDLLAANVYTINQISTMVGYKSPFYFSQEFKKYFGCSPKYYKF